jgi:hypothetical protein
MIRQYSQPSEVRAVDGGIPRLLHFEHARPAATDAQA